MASPAADISIIYAWAFSLRLLDLCVVMDGKEISALKMVKAVSKAQRHPKTEAPLLQEAGERLFEATRETAPSLDLPFRQTERGAFQPYGAIHAKALAQLSAALCRAQERGSQNLSAGPRS